MEKLIFGGIITIVVLLVASLTLSFVAAFDHDEYTATITKMETKRDGESDRYMVFTELVETGETRVFTVEDSLVHFRWDSSDMYGDLKVGKTYTLDTYGWRVPFLTMYENILEATEVE